MARRANISLYHLHSHEKKRAFICAVTPRIRSSLPPFSGSKGQLQSEMAIFLLLRAFQPTGAISVRRVLKNACFFIAFYKFTTILYTLRREKSNVFSRRSVCFAYLSYLFFKRSRISSNNLVFAFAFSSASAASAAAFSAAAFSSSAFFAFASSKRCA